MFIMYFIFYKFINVFVRLIKENIIIELYYVDLFFIIDLILLIILIFFDFL